MIKKYYDLISAKNLFDNSQSQQGTVIHFQNLQEQDVELVQYLLEIDENTQQQKINPNVYRIFNQQYKRISVFTNEQTYHDAGTMYLGNSTDIECNLTGDFIQNTYFTCVLPKVKLDSPLKKFGYVTNLGCSMISAICKLGIQNTAVDYVNSQMNIILNNLYRRKDQRYYFNKLQGNVPEITQLKQEHKNYKIIVPLRFFFSDSPQKIFRKRQANINKLIINVNLKKFEDLICYTRNVQDDIDQNKFFQANLLEKAGILVNEVFVSEQEQVIQSGNTYHLIEQNFIQKSSITEQNQKFILNTFARPTKMIYFAIQKQQYTNKLPFLSYFPTIEGYDFLPQLLEQATKRFILKFATYSMIFSGVEEDAGGDLVQEYTPPSSLYANKITPTATAFFNSALTTDDQKRAALRDLVSDYLTKYIPIVKKQENIFTQHLKTPISCIFSEQPKGLGLIDQNKNYFDIEKVFDKCNPVLLNLIPGAQIEQNIFIAGDLLSIQQASYPIDQKDTNVNCFQKHLPENVISTFVQSQAGIGNWADGEAKAIYYSLYTENVVVPLDSNTQTLNIKVIDASAAALTSGPLLSADFVKVPIISKIGDDFEYQIFATDPGAITNDVFLTVTAGDSYQIILPGVSVKIYNTAANQADINSSFYNRGSSSFDIIVNQYDNFGLNLDGSGEVLLNAQLYLTQNMIFNISSYDMKTHILNYFPGRSNGVSVYSFSLNPEIIQPTGSLSFSQVSPQVQIQSIYDNGDTIYIGSQIYNIMNYVSGSFALEYTSQIGTE